MLFLLFKKVSLFLSLYKELLKPRRVTREGGGGGGLPCPFLKEFKEACPDFGKKCPN